MVNFSSALTGATPLRLVHPLPGSCRKKVRKTVFRSEMLTKKKRFRICQDDESQKPSWFYRVIIMKSDQLSSQHEFHFKSLRKPLLRIIYLSPILSLPRFYSAICCAGVEWFGTSQVRLFRGNDAVNGVELEDGEVLPADCVVVGAGVLPNTRFVEGLSLEPWNKSRPRPRGDEINTGNLWGKKTPANKKHPETTKKKNKKISNDNQGLFGITL